MSLLCLGHIWVEYNVLLLFFIIIYLIHLKGFWSLECQSLDKYLGT